MTLGDNSRQVIKNNVLEISSGVNDNDKAFAKSNSYIGKDTNYIITTSTSTILGANAVTIANISTSTLSALDFIRIWSINTDNTDTLGHFALKSMLFNTDTSSTTLSTASTTNIGSKYNPFLINNINDFTLIKI